MDFEAIDEAGRLDAGILMGLAEKLSPYDPADVLGAVAGLQLLPENADRAVRLEAFAHAAASLDDEPDKPHMTLHRLRQIANAEPLGQGVIASQEDPCDNALTEAFTYHGGMFIVFPGPVDESTFILRHLAIAVFSRPDTYPKPDFVAKAHALLSAVLALSDEIARRAGLGRRVMPIFSGRQGDVVVPDSQRLTQLKQAVSFSLGELDRFLTERQIPLSALDRLIVPLGQVSIADYQIDSGDLQTRPIVRVGDRFIVAIPSILVVAARHELIRLAFEYGVADELAKRYHAAVWSSVVQSLGYLGNIPLPLPPPADPGIPCCQGALFNLDTDKLIYAILVTDSLEEYRLNRAFGTWPLQRVKVEIGKHLQAAREAIFSMSSPPNEVLFLVLVQQVGRAVFWNYQGVETSVSSLQLSLTAADLETIAFLEGGEQLTLWKYARLSWQVREQTHIVAMGELNEFFLYRKNGYSYYISDEQRPDAINILPGGAGELRQEVLRQYDWHAVPSYLPGYVIDVITLYGTRTVPLYVPLRPHDRRAACLVEGLPLPIWITGLDSGDGHQHNIVDFFPNIVSTIAYWLWQCTPSLHALLQSLTSAYSYILIQCLLSADEAWHQQGEQQEPVHQTPLDLTVDSANGVLSLTLNPSISTLFASADNGGERALMQHVLKGLRELLPVSTRGELSDTVIAHILDRHAPLGMKKMLIYSEVNAEPDLDPRGLPPYRKIQEADANELLDELGDYLSTVEQLKPGLIPEDERTNILTKAVAFYYQELAGLVASLRSEGLLEFLIAHQEAITRQSSYRELSIPTQLACFSSEPKMVEQLSRETPELTNAAMASRFIIEYVAARPPTGLRPISLSVYDRLQALASHVIGFGFASDLIHFQLADIRLTMLPSGRLDVDREQYIRAFANYLPNIAISEITHATQAFSQRWQNNDNTPEEIEMWNKLDVAARAEFGCSLTDLQSLMANAFVISEDLDPALACLPLTDFIDRMVEHLCWPREQVSHALDLLTLVPRPDFLNPPSPYRREDTYPWRYNRLLSYVRRPFVYRKHGDTIEILWGNRHLYKAAFYLIHICLAGRLQAQSIEMLQLMGTILHKQGEVFNDQVADMLMQNLDLIVLRRVKKVGKLRVPGDIDVLVADPKRRRLGIIECKDFVAAHTPYEMDSELKKFFQGDNGKKSAIKKVEERVAWVHEHVEEVLTWLQLDGTGKASRWRVEPLIVVSQELFTPYLRRSSIPVMSFDKLTRGQIW